MVSLSFIGELAKIVPKEFVLTKITILKTMYLGNNVMEQCRPLPDICRLIGVAELNTLAKDDGKLRFLEELFASTRNACESHMAKLTSPPHARELLQNFETEVVRMAMSKSLTSTFKHGVSGKFSNEKAHVLRAHWVSWVQKSSASFELFSTTCGIDAFTAGSVGVLTDEVRHTCRRS